MKSFQVLNLGFAYTGYSELQVMRSAAGFYLGTIYTDPEYGFQEPGSRDSDYFVHKEQASQALAKLEWFAENCSPKDKEDWTFISTWELWLIKEGLDPHCVGYRMYP